MIINKIFDFVFDKFGSKPEYLWSRTPDCAVLRNTRNNKWFAIVMNVKNERLGINKCGSTKIINLKCDPIMISSMLKRKGFLPAYHMNKEHWIGIDLNNEELKFEEILNFICLSFEIVEKVR